MRARDYLRIVADRWKLVAFCVALGIGGAVLATVLSPRTYQARVQLFVSADPSEDQTAQYQGNAFAQSRIQTYVAIVTAPDVLDAVRTDLHLTLSNDELKAKLSADAPADRTILNLYAADASPSQAAAIANSAASAFARTVEKYETPSGSRNSSVRLVVTDPADAPASPASPQPSLNVAIGFFVGLLIGISAAVLRDALDNSLKTADALAAAAGAPPLGTVVADARTGAEVVAAEADPRGARAENYRQLRTNLSFADLDAKPRVLAVTSAMPGEGKTSTAVNLAFALVEGGFSVCLVDADLRRPAVARALGLVGTVGLTSVLINQVSLAGALQQVGDHLYVLTAGAAPPNPSGVLASNHARDLIRGLTEKVDYVVIDTAPLLPVADGAQVAAIADGCLLVARHGSTTDAQARRGAQALARVEARLLGVVLNRVPVRQAAEYGYAYYGEPTPGRHVVTEGA